MMDMIAKGRGSPLTKSGEEHGNSRLRSKSVIEIVRLYRQGHTRRYISEKTGVHLSSVAQIVDGRQWVSVTGIRREEIVSRIGRNQYSKGPRL